VVRDIKPPNILFDSFDQPVLADFGIAEVVSLSTSIKDTFNYMDPETYLDAKADGQVIAPPVDVWAMACVVVEMHTRKVPWDCMNMQQIMMSSTVHFRAPAVPETAPTHVLLARCFLCNPEDHPSVGDLADAFADAPELCEEMERLNSANTNLESKLKAAETVLAEERFEREKEKSGKGNQKDLDLVRDSFFKGDRKPPSLAVFSLKQ
jgi:serine/threonine protein kinase